MKCFLISENDAHVSAFRQMGVESFLADSNETAINEVQRAISCRKIGTLILSERVREASKSVLDSHLESGRLPFVMTLNG